MYKVVVTKKILKSLKKLPRSILLKFFILENSLKESGPIQYKFSNYSKLGERRFHCHLNYSWVVCWKLNLNGNEIEVYYVGSRENAPY